ncbi:MAG: hypothetical protein LBT13_06585 [Treponema sp.]|nr:hypothetical protein [Treponema sp.]
MAWRFVVFILICSIFLIFITLNLENKCDISFGFMKIEGVYVWVTAFASFGLGTFCTILFTLFSRVSKKLRSKSGKPGSLKSIKRGDDTDGSNAS